ncbi:MAG: 2-oxo acid dehydrogenase subunit E2 [Anaerolineae bacterium]|nr:2-oxo acid dehydrogenase subunit E2 [Anaerolineae bacterium]
MATEIIVPKVDMVMETGTFVEWLKKEGETVQKGEPLFVIMTDKSAIECEAPATGILGGITAKPDDVLPVTSIIGYVLKEGEAAPAKNSQSAPSAPSGASPSPEPPQAAGQSRLPESSVVQSDQAEKLVRATPLARKLAKEMGIKLENVPGKGPRGRIYQSDIEAYLQNNKVTAPASQSDSTTPASSVSVALPAANLNIPLPNARVKERISLKGARAIIAQRLSYSSSTIPHIHETISIDMTETKRLHERVAPVIKEQTGLKVSMTAILVYAIARLLKRHPYLNSSFTGEEIVLWDDVHIGVATNLDDYLIVPVVREAQNKDLREIVDTMASLLEKARSKRLEPSEMTGSTFTISNLGMFGIEDFTAIINPPESAILAVGKIIDTPVFINGNVEVRPIMKVTLAADHRVNDGVRVARFLSDLKGSLENPYLLM